MALILIIEDEFHLRTALAAGLQRAGFETTEAGDGEEGYALLQEKSPDLVLCDIGLPALSGDQLLVRLRRDRPDLRRLPFLFLTALADRDSVIAGHELGADDYLTKPVDLDLLVAAIHQRLGQVDRWDASYSADLEEERHRFLSELSERTHLSFLSAADVLNHLSEGVLLLNATGRAIFVNRAARRILAAEDGLALREGMLTGDRTEDTRRLQDLLQKVLCGGAGPEVPVPAPLAVARPSGRRAYVLRACRLEAGLDLGADSGVLGALFITDADARPRPSEAQLAALYDLTQAEARIVAHLAMGLSVGDIAAALSISSNTIHHHLKSIFRKTETARQSELVALVLSGAAHDPGG